MVRHQSRRRNARYPQVAVHGSHSSINLLSSPTMQSLGVIPYDSGAGGVNFPEGVAFSPRRRDACGERWQRLRPVVGRRYEATQEPTVPDPCHRSNSGRFPHSVPTDHAGYRIDDAKVFLWNVASENSVASSESQHGSARECETSHLMARSWSRPRGISRAMRGLEPRGPQWTTHYRRQGRRHRLV